MGVTMNSEQVAWRLYDFPVFIVHGFQWNVTKKQGMDRSRVCKVWPNLLAQPVSDPHLTHITQPGSYAGRS